MQFKVFTLNCTHAKSIRIFHRPALGTGFPVLVSTGPRQFDRTTLVPTLFADKPYVTVEAPEARSFADFDFRGFQARFPQGAVLDEAQRCTDLFPYLQDVVDVCQRMGEFIFTGRSSLV